MLQKYTFAGLLFGLLSTTAVSAKSGEEPRRTPQTAQATQAAGGAFAPGTNVLQLGIGIGSRYSYVGSGVSSSPAFSASFERSILELGPGTVGLGAFVGYQSASSDFSGFGKYTFRDIIVAVRGAYHYPVSEQFDAYGGLAVGIRNASVSFDGSSSLGVASSATGGYSALFVGGRYFFTDNIGAFAELGYDQTYLKAGLALKF